jgi:hypothetical protein
MGQIIPHGALVAWGLGRAGASPLEFEPERARREKDPRGQQIKGLVEEKTHIRSVFAAATLDSPAKPPHSRMRFLQKFMDRDKEATRSKHDCRPLE